MEKSNKTSNFSVELTVKNNDVVETFDSLKKLQEMGYAGVDSTIVYKNVRVPAGYCTDFHNFIITYGAIISGDHASVFEQVPEDLEKDDVLRFLVTCSQSLEKCDRLGLSRDDVVNFLDYRESQKNSESKK